jgi:hypothetical protein
MASRMAERVSDLGERARGRMTETRLDKVDRENDRLKYEVRLLRDDLQEERGALQRALDALSRDEHVTVETKVKKPRGRLLRMIVIGGGAYLLGARAGRGRYEEIMDKARGMKDSMQKRTNGDQGDGTAWQGSTQSSAVPTSPPRPSDATATS